MHALPCFTFQIFMLHKTSRQSLNLSTAFISANYCFKRSKPFLADFYYYQNIKETQLTINMRLLVPFWSIHLHLLKNIFFSLSDPSQILVCFWLQKPQSQEK